MGSRMVITKPGDLQDREGETAACYVHRLTLNLKSKPWNLEDGLIGFPRTDPSASNIDMAQSTLSLTITTLQPG